MLDYTKEPLVKLSEHAKEIVKEAYDYSEYVFKKAAWGPGDSVTEFELIQGIIEAFEDAINKLKERIKYYMEASYWDSDLYKEFKETLAMLTAYYDEIDQPVAIEDAQNMELFYSNPMTKIAYLIIGEQKERIEAAGGIVETINDI